MSDHKNLHDALADAFPASKPRDESKPINALDAAIREHYREDKSDDE